MNLAKETRDLLQTRYVRDFKRLKRNKIKDRKAALSRERAVREAVAGGKRRRKPVSEDHKRMCASLIGYYSSVKDMEKREQAILLQNDIIEIDLNYIAVQDFGESFAGYLLKERRETNLARVRISELYPDYAKRAAEKLRDVIIDKVQVNEAMEYADAFAMERRFILHIGGTNSGKTYSSIERLKEAQCGVYAGPLRLLALEIYDKLTEADVPCSMLTGEEQYICENSFVTAATVEMVSLRKEYDIAVIDEAQMISDPFRGHVWSRLIMGLKAHEIHLCMAPEAEQVIIRLLRECQQSYEVVHHERNTELVFEDKPFVIETDIMQGDALILFSKKAVLDVAARLEMMGVRASVIYGNLPPQIRKKQFEMFLRGKTQVVVATDAIGLGVNLPIRRIIFMTVMKFDGRHYRPLNQYEVRQIAGRAGRRGLYDQGYVTATSYHDLHRIRETYKKEIPLRDIRIGFPTPLLELEAPIDMLLTEWSKIKPELKVYKKVDVAEMLDRYKILKNLEQQGYDFGDRMELFSLMSCEVDIGNRDCVRLWKEYCITYKERESMRFPEMEEATGINTLEQAESYYRMLDLYNQFSTRFQKPREEQRMMDARVDVEAIILEELGKSKKGYLRRCNYCGKLLPIGTRWPVCDSCYSG